MLNCKKFSKEDSNNIAILLYGLALSKDNLEAQIRNFKKFKHVFYSTYSDFNIEELVHKDYLIINNDILGKYNIDFKETWYHSRNTNYSIIHINRGMKYIKEKYNNIKYVLLLRIDILFKSPHNYIDDFLRLIDNTPKSNQVLEKKIITLNHYPNEVKKFYFCNYLLFATMNDMYTYSDIPLISSYKYHNLRPDEYLGSSFIKKGLGHNFTDEFYKIDSMEDIKFNDFYIDYRKIDKTILDKVFYIKLNMNVKEIFLTYGY